MERIQLDDQDVFVEIMDLGDTKIPETVVLNDDGSYTIFINARFSFEKQQESVNHALKHIKADDFFKNDVSVQQIETETHGISTCKPNEPQQSENNIDKILKKKRRFVRRHKNYQKKLAEYEAFANRMRDEDPSFFYSHQQDLSVY